MGETLMDITGRSRLWDVERYRKGRFLLRFGFSVFMEKWIKNCKYRTNCFKKIAP